MHPGDVVGHETMGVVIELGPEVKNLTVGDRVVVPFTIACGECFFCKRGFFSGCERTNPNMKAAEKLWGHSPAGLFGYSHMTGGYRGGQAEYLRSTRCRSGWRWPKRAAPRRSISCRPMFTTHCRI
jgi:threonine dehydrogenase-like Zn-dependent dehydrogenase